MHAAILGTQGHDPKISGYRIDNRVVGPAEMKNEVF